MWIVSEILLIEVRAIYSTLAINELWYLSWMSDLECLQMYYVGILPPWYKS